MGGSKTVEPRVYVREWLETKRAEGVAFDLGHDHWGSFYVRGESDAKVGLMVFHPGGDGGWCVGAVMFDVPATADLGGHRWTLHTLDPLELSPSILCRMPHVAPGSGPDDPRVECGDHGFIRGGRWVPA